MRAAMIKAFGEPTEVLELVDVPEPTGPAAGEVLVGVEYAPVNMNDLYVIQGVFPVRPALPSVVGNECVGRVLAVGSGVEHLKAGDRVLVPLDAGHGVFECDEPSTTFGQFGDERVTAVARGLDAALARTLVRAAY
jgi:NADPH:quinone reductase-like Zn-dependent oxidoreductase